MPRLLTDTEISAALLELPGWSRSSEEIVATFRLVGFAGALGFVNRVAAEAEEMDHHPDIDIRWDTVRLAVATHSQGGLTQLDIELAHRINALGPAASSGDA